MKQEMEVKEKDLKEKHRTSFNLQRAGLFTLKNKATKTLRELISLVFCTIKGQ